MPTESLLRDEFLIDPLTRVFKKLKAQRAVFLSDLEFEDPPRSMVAEALDELVLWTPNPELLVLPPPSGC